MKIIGIVAVALLVGCNVNDPHPPGSVFVVGTVDAITIRSGMGEAVLIEAPYRDGDDEEQWAVIRVRDDGSIVVTTSSSGDLTPEEIREIIRTAKEARGADGVGTPPAGDGR